MPKSDIHDSELSVTIRGAAAEQRLFGRYTLKKVLGRGGMGVVWLAHDDELQRNVAMKFLPDMIIRDREAVEDLKRETRRSLDLTHHHIVRIYDFTQDDQCAAIVMEYVDGESLSAMKTHQESNCFSVPGLQNWVSHFCQAMDYAHRQARVVHRDLKPANLMVNGRGDLKVTDFGISRSMSDSMTRVSMSNSAGTLAYMSPEQALGSPPAIGDDIYAFGATVYDLLTGRPPFFRGNLQVQLETVVPPPMEARRAELGNKGEPIPALWEEIIAACLAKRPQDRPQGMMEIASLLGVGVSTNPLSYRPPSSNAAGGAGAPGTTPTSAGTTTKTSGRAPAPEEMATQAFQNPPSTPATTGRSGPAGAAPQATRPEDVMVNIAPHVTALRPTTSASPIPAVPATTPTNRSTPAPPVAPVPSVSEPEPAPPSPVIPEPEIAPAPVVAEAPPPPAPVEEEIVAEEMTIQAVVAKAKIAPKPEPAETLYVPPPPESVAPAMPRVPPVHERTKIGIGIGPVGHRPKKSSNIGLIAAGVAVAALAAGMGIFFATRPPASAPDPRQAQIAQHIAAATTALAAGDLTAAAEEIEAVKTADPANAGIASLEDALKAEREKRSAEARRVADEKAAAAAAAAKIAAAAAADAADAKKIEDAKNKETADIEAKTKALAQVASELQRSAWNAARTAIAKVPASHANDPDVLGTKSEIDKLETAERAEVAKAAAEAADKARLAKMEDDRRAAARAKADKEDERKPPKKAPRKPDPDPDPPRQVAKKSDPQPPPKTVIQPPPSAPKPNAPRHAPGD